MMSFPSRTHSVVDGQHFSAHVQGYESLQNALLFSHERTRSFATDTIAMFDHFMDHMMPFIVREFSKIEVLCAETKTKHLVQFGNLTIHKPLVQEMDSTSVSTAKNLRILTNLPCYPEEARARGLTYVCHVLVDIDYSTYKMSNPSLDDTVLANYDTLAEPPIQYREVPLVNVPVMLRSKYCHLSNPYNRTALKECLYDQGGYFIIRGNAKVIQPQKVQRINVHITHAPPGRPGQLPITCEIRSLRSDEKFRSTSTLYMHFAAPSSGCPPTFTVDIPFLAKGTPLLCVFRVLGFTTRSSIEDFLWDSLEDPRRRLFQSVYDDGALQETMDALYTRMGHGMYNEADLTPDKVRRQVQQQVLGELLPHCGYEDTATVRFKKAVYLRTMIHKTLDVYLGRAEADDRDFEGYKCVHMSATILSTLFRQLFSMFVKTIRNKMYDRFKRNKHLDVASLVAHSDSLSRDLLKAFSEGEVTVKQASNAGSGVIQMTHQINPLGISTHIQRVSTALPRDGKYTLMRGVDSTQLFSFDPAETPEGHGAGLLQNLTLFAVVRIGIEMKFIADTIFYALPDFAKKLGLVMHLERLQERHQLRWSLIYINGDPLGATQTPDSFVEALRSARRSQMIPYDISIIRTFHGILIFCDMGTIVFPLLHLESLRKFMLLKDLDSSELWTKLVQKGIIEYVDSWELLEYRVAMKPQDITNFLSQDRTLDWEMPYTHMAVHPCALLGTSSCTVPWSDHNQAPRVSYQAGMVKQAVSVPATNYEDRFDLNAFHVLWYPQKPMADTLVSEARRTHEWPMGENLMIAIASYEGLCQEDAIIRNRASIDRGSGRTSVYKMYKAVVRKIGSDYEAFESPMDEPQGVPCIGIRGESDYSKVDKDGLPSEGTRVKNNDVLIGRVFYTTDDSGRKVRRDRSIIVICEDTETFLVDKVLVTMNRDGLLQVRVRLRTMRVPQVGDKISDRHGQKGVIGTLMAEEDLPYIAYGPNAGMRPDCIINLHCINGRMTIAKLLEMLYSSLGLVLGDFVDASPFQDISAQWALEELCKQGYGSEFTMINGTTGEIMTRPWFIGSCFYQTLKHMVLDKVAARNRGPRAQLTRQPLDGRANQGGQRMGEMEKDAFLAHGASFTLDDRSRVASDGISAPVCTQCGQIGESDTTYTIKGLTDEFEHLAFSSADALDAMQETPSGGSSEEPIRRREHCRACNAPMTRIETTYCYSNLLVRELATLGIKVSHQMESQQTASTTEMQVDT